MPVRWTDGDDLARDAGWEPAELVRVTGLWMERLRVNDWHVEIEMTRRYRLAGVAQVVSHWQTKSATVSLSPPDDCPPESAYDRDLENSIVHELLHLYFAGWNSGHEGLCEDLMEQTICKLTTALLDGYGRALKKAKKRRAA